MGLNQAVMVKYLFMLHLKNNHAICVEHNLNVCFLVVIQCPGLSNISSGVVDTSGGTSYKCTAVYSYTGYVLNGMVTRTCQEDSTWSGVEPICDGI